MRINFSAGIVLGECRQTNQCRATKKLLRCKSRCCFYLLIKSKENNLLYPYLEKNLLMNGRIKGGQNKRLCSALFCLTKYMKIRLVKFCPMNLGLILWYKSQAKIGQSWQKFTWATNIFVRRNLVRLGTRISSNFQKKWVALLISDKSNFSWFLVETEADSTLICF